MIDYINGNLSIDETEKKSYYINSIVDMEVCVGAKHKRELNTINKKLSSFISVDINQEIMDLSTMLVNEYTLSHNMTIYDAIIASTCMVYDLPLWTHNKKDFRYLKQIKFAYT